MAKFSITLTENYKQKMYRISEELYLLLSNKLQPYRSAASSVKPVRCIETGKIFNCARQAAEWIYQFEDTNSEFFSIEAKIKRVCKGQQGGAFGYNWEFTNEDDRIRKPKQELKRWHYYANLKNQSHSKSYKITEELFKNLSKELAPFCVSKENNLAVKCVETGHVFSSASSAARWVTFVKEITGCAPEKIDNVCGCKDKTMYGFHWEYIAKEDLNKIDEITSKSDFSLNSNELSLKLHEIESMKYILDIEENQEISYENLKSQIEDLCRSNFVHLIVLKSYLSEMPKQVKQAIDNIIKAKDNEEKCRHLYEEYLNQYQTNQIFKEYQNYIYMQRSQDAIKEINDKNLKDIAPIYENIESELIKYKQIQTALLFNILSDMQGAFVPIDFTENLPQLVMWVNNNNNKPIEELTDDESKIIAGLMGGLSVKQIFKLNTLSRFVRSCKNIENIIEALSQKFGVTNITQVIFRIYLLKPHIWNNTEYYELVNSIKRVSETV